MKNLFHPNFRFKTKLKNGHSKTEAELLDKQAEELAVLREKQAAELNAEYEEFMRPQREAEEALAEARYARSLRAKKRALAMLRLADKEAKNISDKEAQAFPESDVLPVWNWFCRGIE